MDQNIEKVLEEYFQGIDSIDEAEVRLYNQVKFNYKLNTKIRNESQELLMLLRKENFNDIPAQLGYIQMKFKKKSGPLLLEAKLYFLYWQKQLIPSIEHWLKEMLANRNIEDKMVFEKVTVFQEKVLKHILISKPEDTLNLKDRLQFIVENAVLVRDLNMNLATRFRKCGAARDDFKWHTSLRKENAGSQTQEKLSSELKIVVGCILYGCTNEVRKELQTYLNRFSLELMSINTRESFLLFNRVLNFSFFKDKSPSLEEELIKTLVEKLCLAFDDSQKSMLAPFPIARTPKLLESMEQWYINLRLIFLDEYGFGKNENEMVYSMRMGKCTLSKDYEKFFVDSERSKLVSDRLKESEEPKLPPGQSHKVVKITLPTENEPDIFCKFYPDGPGDEYSVRTLYRLMLEPDMPLMDLVRLPAPSKDVSPIPLLISEGIKGRNLAEYWNNGVRFRLDKEAFSRSVIMNMVTNPLDLKPENIIVEDMGLDANKERRYRLRFFDNDQSFLPPIYEEEVEAKIRRHLGVKTAVLCFDEMLEPLHPKVVEEFLKLDIYEVLRSWIIDITRFNINCCQNMFTPEQCKTLAELPGKQATVLIAQLEPQLVEELYNKLFLMRDTLKKERNIPAIRLLTTIYPELGPYYLDALKNKSLTPAQRFKQIVADEYVIVNDPLQFGSQYCTSTSMHTVAKARYGLIPNRIKESVEAGDLLFERLNRLDSLRVQYGSIDTVVQSLLRGEKDKFNKLTCLHVKERVISKIIFPAFKPDQQLFILRQMQGCSFRSLNLSNCESLTDDILMKIIRKSSLLKQLDISYCKNLKFDATHLQLLSDYCQYLESLNLEGNQQLHCIGKHHNPLKQLYDVIRMGVLEPNSPLKFERLVKLNVSRCTTLVALHIDAPQLISIKASGCVKLEIADISAPNVRKLDFRGSKNVQLKIMQHNLKRILIADCHRYRYGDFFQKYPPLFKNNLNEVSGSFIHNFEDALESVLTENGIKITEVPKNIIDVIHKMINHSVRGAKLCRSLLLGPNVLANAVKALGSKALAESLNGLVFCPILDAVGVNTIIRELNLNIGDKFNIATLPHPSWSHTENSFFGIFRENMIGEDCIFLLGEFGSTQSIRVSDVLFSVITVGRDKKLSLVAAKAIAKMKRSYFRSGVRDVLFPDYSMYAARDVLLTNYKENRGYDLGFVEEAFKNQFTFRFGDIHRDFLSKLCELLEDVDNELVANTIVLITKLYVDPLVGYQIPNKILLSLFACVNHKDPKVRLSAIAAISALSKLPFEDEKMRLIAVKILVESLLKTLSIINELKDTSELLQELKLLRDKHFEALAKFHHNTETRELLRDQLSVLSESEFEVVIKVSSVLLDCFEDPIITIKARELLWRLVLMKLLGKTSDHRNRMEIAKLLHKGSKISENLVVVKNIVDEYLLSLENNVDAVVYLLLDEGFLKLPFTPEILEKFLVNLLKKAETLYDTVIIANTLSKYSESKEILQFAINAIVLSLEQRMKINFSTTVFEIEETIDTLLALNASDTTLIKIIGIALPLIMRNPIKDSPFFADYGFIKKLTSNAKIAFILEHWLCTRYREIRYFYGYLSTATMLCLLPHLKASKKTGILHELRDLLLEIMILFKNNDHEEIDRTYLHPNFGGGFFGCLPREKDEGIHLKLDSSTIKQDILMIAQAIVSLPVGLIEKQAVAIEILSTFSVKDLQDIGLSLVSIFAELFHTDTVINHFSHWLQEKLQSSKTKAHKKPKVKESIALPEKPIPKESVSHKPVSQQSLLPVHGSQDPMPPKPVIEKPAVNSGPSQLEQKASKDTSSSGVISLSASGSTFQVSTPAISTHVATINASPRDNNCGLYSLVLGAEIAIRNNPSLAAQVILPDFLKSINYQCLISGNETEATIQIGKKLRSEIFQALQQDGTYKRESFTGFAECCRAYLETGSHQKTKKADMNAFVAANTNFITKLRGEWQVLGQVYDQKLYDEQRVAYESALSKHQLEVEMLAKLTTELSSTIRNGKLDQVPVLIDNYIKTHKENIIETRRLFRTAWLHIPRHGGDGAAAQAEAVKRKRFADEIDKVFKSRWLNFLKVKEFGKNPWLDIHNLLTVAFSEKSNFREDGVLRKISDKSEIDSTVVSFFVEYILEQRWDVIYKSYCEHIQKSSEMLSIQELNALAQYWHLQLYVSFGGGPVYPAYKEERNLQLPQITLCNPSEIHWMVSLSRTLVEATAQAASTMGKKDKAEAFVPAFKGQLRALDRGLEQKDRPDDSKKNDLRKPSGKDEAPFSEKGKVRFI